MRVALSMHVEIKEIGLLKGGMVGFSRHGRLLISLRIRNGALYKLARQAVHNEVNVAYQRYRLFLPTYAYLFLFLFLRFRPLFSLSLLLFFFLCNINRALFLYFPDFIYFYLKYQAFS